MQFSLNFPKQPFAQFYPRALDPQAVDVAQPSVAVTIGGERPRQDAAEKEGRRLGLRHAGKAATLQQERGLKPKGVFFTSIVYNLIFILQHY
jgi:hypothetical protein